MSNNLDNFQQFTTFAFVKFTNTKYKVIYRCCEQLQRLWRYIIRHRQDIVSEACFTAKYKADL